MEIFPSALDGFSEAPVSGSASAVGRIAAEAEGRTGT